MYMDAAKDGAKLTRSKQLPEVLYTASAIVFTYKSPASNAVVALYFLMATEPIPATLTVLAPVLVLPT